MKLRETTVDDVDPMVELVMAMLREMAAYGGRSLNGEACVIYRLRERFLDSLEKDDHVYLFALAEGREKPVGIVEASVVSPPKVFRPASVLHVHALYVEPSLRGEGIGRRLLEEALTWGRERGCTEGTLSVLAGNPARELYERVGFEVFELEMRLEW